MHHPTWIEIQMQSFFSTTLKRKENTSKTSWPNAVNSHTFVLMSWIYWTWRHDSTTKRCRRPSQEIMKVLFRNHKRHEVEDEYCNCTNHASMHPRITHPHDPSVQGRPALHPACFPLEKHKNRPLRIEKMPSTRKLVAVKNQKKRECKRTRDRKDWWEKDLGTIFLRLSRPGVWPMSPSVALVKTNTLWWSSFIVL